MDVLVVDDCIGCGAAFASAVEQLVKCLVGHVVIERTGYAEDKAAGPYPYSAGEMKAYWVFKFRRENDADEFEMSDYCWDKEFHDFVETLRKLGITEFTITNHSTALMENIYGFIAEGCTMEGTHTITKKARRWAAEDYEQVMGIRFKVN